MYLELNDPGDNNWDWLEMIIFVVQSSTKDHTNARNVYEHHHRKMKRF